MLSLSTLKKSMDVFFLFLFITVIGLPLLNGLTSSNDKIQRTEKRKAAELPALELDKESLSTYPGRFESFYDDNFGFRDELIYLHNYIKVFIFGVSPADRVVLGKDGWLFYNSTWDGNPIADYRNLGQFSENLLKRKTNVLIQRNSWLARQGKKYLYVILPNKSTIYPEYMPDYLNRVRKFSLLDQFVTYVKRNTDVPVIDLRPDLINARKSMPVYAQTGTHWNDYGAYIASNVIFQELNTWFPEIRAIQLPDDSFGVQTLPGDDLALMLGFDQVMMEDTIVGPKRSLDCGDRKPIETPRFTVYGGISFSLDCNKSKYRALVFRDSFSKKLVPYLSDQFSQITYVWTRPNNKSFMWYVNKHHPDVVIEIHVERYLRSYP